MIKKYKGAIKLRRTMLPVINHQKCNQCGICVFQCGKNVFDIKLMDVKAFKIKVYPAKPKDCVYCLSVKIGVHKRL